MLNRKRLRYNCNLMQFVCHTRWEPCIACRSIPITNAAIWTYFGGIISTHTLHQMPNRLTSVSTHIEQLHQKTNKARDCILFVLSQDQSPDMNIYKEFWWDLFIFPSFPQINKATSGSIVTLAGSAQHLLRYDLFTIYYSSLKSQVYNAVKPYIACTMLLRITGRVCTYVYMAGSNMQMCDN